MCLIKVHSSPHLGDVLAASSGLLPRTLGTFLGLEVQWGKWKQKPDWPANPNIQPQTPSISKDWSFVVILSLECTITTTKCSKRPIHPQHSFFYLLSWVEEYILSPCVLLPGKKSRFDQQKIWLSLFLPSCYLGEGGKGQRGYTARLAASLCQAARYLQASRGELCCRWK